MTTRHESHYGVAPSPTITDAMLAHGGLDRWQAISRIDVDAAIGGALWANRGQPDLLADVHVSADTRRQHLIFDRVGPHQHRSTFTPGHITIHDRHGALVSTRADIRSTYPADADAPWDEAQVAYFAGYALWNYLTLPFLAVAPAVRTRDVNPWPGADPSWRRVQIDFPPTIDTHNSTQYLNIDADGLLVRHDYDADVLGGAPAVNAANDFREHNGLVFATRRRVTARSADGAAADGPVLVSIDFHDIRLR